MVQDTLTTACGFSAARLERRVRGGVRSTEEGRELVWLASRCRRWSRWSAGPRFRRSFGVAFAAGLGVRSDQSLLGLLSASLACGLGGAVLALAGMILAPLGQLLFVGVEADVGLLERRLPGRPALNTDSWSTAPSKCCGSPADRWPATVLAF